MMDDMIIETKKVLSHLVISSQHRLMNYDVTLHLYDTFLSFQHLGRAFYRPVFLYIARHWGNYANAVKFSDRIETVNAYGRGNGEES